MVRPRSEEARRQVLATTVQLLAEVGVDGLTIEAVAAGSGVAKTTIYRHWADRSELITDAVRACLPRVPDPDTGSLRDDLHTIFEHIARAEMDSPAGDLMPSLMDAVHRDPTLAQLKRDVITERERPVVAAIQRAQARGELDASLDEQMVYDAVVGPIVFRKVVRREQVTPERVHAQLDLALRGLGVDVGEGATP
jgi:AcrR family transcriptional regulator